ncbi:MAG: terpene cyclase/mutase family protein [Phycisphaeraceae bacterium]|nr:terpene cyclase/mutase family protein [Phycisphaeraceae bacterium]
MKTPKTMRMVLAALVAAVSVLGLWSALPSSQRGALVASASASAGDPIVISPRPPHITPQAERAIDNGIRFLVNSQARDGSWRSSMSGGGHPVSMTSLAGLALLATGNTPTEGPHAENVRRAVNFVLASANRSTGLITRPEESQRSMYPHGYALLFLAEAYGMETDVERQNQIRRVLQQAVRLTERSQSSWGGWYYTPDSTNDEGSVTITQVQGLRAARNAGILVSAKTIENAIGYLEKSANPDGGIRYTARSQGGSLPAITAQAVASLYNAGDYQNPVAQGALEFLKRRTDGDLSRLVSQGGHSTYTLFYTSQAMYLSGDAEWNAYFPPLREHLIRTQRADGGWQGDYVGDIYGTAVTVMALSLPYRHLPIFQR